VARLLNQVKGQPVAGKQLPGNQEQVTELLELLKV